MYMNCAVVDLIGSDARASRKVAGDSAGMKDLGSAAVAQAALEHLPDMYVANLGGVNGCTTRETQDVVFDDPGDDVMYGDGLSASLSRIRRRSKGACIGLGRTSAPAASSDSANAWSAAGGSAVGNDGMWHPDQGSPESRPSGATASEDDGLHHTDQGIETMGNSYDQESASKSPSTNSDAELSSATHSSDAEPSSEGEKELNAYLASLNDDVLSKESISSGREDAIQPQENLSPHTNDKSTTGSFPHHFNAYDHDPGLYSKFRTQLTTRQAQVEEKPTGVPDNDLVKHMDHAANDGAGHANEHTGDSTPYDIEFFPDQIDEQSDLSYSSHSGVLSPHPKKIVDSLETKVDDVASNVLSSDGMQAFESTYDRLANIKKPSKSNKSKKQGKKGKHGPGKFIGSAFI